MKVLLVGSAGQLGTALAERVPEGVELVALGRRDLDIADKLSVTQVTRRYRPTAIVNAAAYTQVDQAETDRVTAFQVNAEGPRILAEAAAEIGARLVHVSTDFVFGGDRGKPYDVDAATGPLNVYGHTKLSGERAVLDVLGANAVIIRVSWLYSSIGRNFVTTVLRLLESKETLRVVADQVGSPTWAGSLSPVIWDIAFNRDIQGIQHWSDEGVASWYDFAVAIQEEGLARGLLTRAADIQAIAAVEYPTSARRPYYSVLNKRRTAALLGYAPSHWRDRLRSMLDELAAS